MDYELAVYVSYVRYKSDMNTESVSKRGFHDTRDH